MTAMADDLPKNRRLECLLYSVLPLIADKAERLNWVESSHNRGYIWGYIHFQIF